MRATRENRKIAASRERKNVRDPAKKKLPVKEVWHAGHVQKKHTVVTSID
jgi:hypothetical protein